MIAAALRAGLEAARAVIAAAREAGSPHLAPSPDLLEVERQLHGPRPGDLVVYGWYVGRDKKRHPGHVGLLSAVPGWQGELPAAVVEARRWVGQGRYKLGAGGRNPVDGTPFDKDGLCDCSGFASHCLGIDRFDDGTGTWWNTTAIRADSLTPGGRWDPVALYGVDLRLCKAIHCHGGKPPAVSETSAALWHQRGVVARLVA